jgi:hypothetical protein
MIVEDMNAIFRRMRADGVERPAHAAEVEWNRQRREYQREQETNILAMLAELPADATGPHADLIRDLGGSIQDHRAAGNYIRG